MGKGAGSAKQEVNEYRLSLHYGISWEVDGLKKIMVGDKTAWQGNVTTPTPIYINQPNLFGGPKKEGGCVGIAYFLPGRPDQVMPNTLATRFGLTSLTCPGFRGLASLFFVGSAATNFETGEFMGIPITLSSGGDYRGGFYWTANSPFIQPVSMEVYCAPKGLNPAYAMIGDDANPAGIVYECLTDTEFGMSAPTYQLNTPVWEAVAQQLYDEEFGISIKWTSQMEIEAFVSEILDHVQATLYVHPRTGLLEIKLLRDDYDFETLREVNPGNARFTSFQRKMWGQTANEIVVSWTNPVNEKEETVTAHDLGAIAAQGDTVSDSRNYYGIRNAELAARVAARDVRASAAPLALVEAELDRSFWDTLPGEVLRVNWPEKQIYNLVMRVMKVNYGRKGEPAIKVTLLEDVFSLVKPIAQVPPATGWQGIAEQPQPMQFAKVFTLPSFLASQQLGTAASELKYPEVVAGLLTYQPGGDTFAYNLYSQAPMANGTMAWRDGGLKTILGRAQMITPLYQQAVSEVEGLPLLELNRGPQVGGFVFIGNGGDTGTEIALLRSLDETEDFWTIDRGVLDTVPRDWPVDTPVWFVPRQCVISDTDQVRSVGETAEYKMLTRTSLGQLAIGSAPVVAGTLTARPHLPLRPANCKINGTGFGEVNAASAGSLVCTWSCRNRLTEDGQVVKWTAGNVAGEYLQQTLITVYRANGAEMFQIRGLYTETTFTIPLAWVEQETRIFVRFSSERQGLTSLQNYGLWVKNLPSVAVPSPPPASPIIANEPPPPPDPDPDPTPPPLPVPDPAPATVPGGGGGRREWRMVHL